MKRSVVAALMLFGCATANASAPIYSFTARDDPKGRRFILNIENTGTSSFCLGNYSWPTPSGAIGDAEQSVSVIAEERSHPMLPFNVGVCLDCEIRVRPGRTETAAIPYSKFDMPEAAYDEAKVLVLDPDPYVC